MIRKLKSGEYRLYSRKKNAKTGKRRNLEPSERGKLRSSTSVPSNTSSVPEPLLRKDPVTAAPRRGLSTLESVISASYRHFRLTLQYSLYRLNTPLREVQVSALA
jgi:hypothetical protein